SGLSIALSGNKTGDGYNFGELLGASLSGVVFDDKNSDGVKQGGEPGVVNAATMTLTGTDDFGSVNSATSTSSGNWSFTGLRPGTYVITETQPLGYSDGIITVGT